MFAHCIEIIPASVTLPHGGVIIVSMSTVYTSWIRDVKHIKIIYPSSYEASPPHENQMKMHCFDFEKENGNVC